MLTVSQTDIGDINQLLWLQESLEQHVSTWGPANPGLQSEGAPSLPIQVFWSIWDCSKKNKTLLSFQRCPLLCDKRKPSLTRTFMLNWSCAIIWGNVCCEQVTWCIWTKLYKKDNKYITILLQNMGDLLTWVMWRVELKVMRWSKFATLVWLPDLLAGTNCDVGNDDGRRWWSWKAQ